MSPPNYACMDFAAVLLEWYEKNGRELPWRKSGHPYEIWLSEVILQQTRMEQGLDYFERFLEAFPTVEALAAASQEQVLRQWQGLGYYSRARNLHKSAQQVVSERGGRLPGSSKEWLRLKGVGSYTAAAIASMAFNEDLPALDGNVYRVLARVFAIEHSIDSAAGKRHFEELATNLLPRGRAGAFNQAMMDFGSLVCRPVHPLCVQCMIQPMCEAFARDRVHDYPRRKGKKQPVDRYFYYFLFYWEEPPGAKQFFVQERDKKGIWQHMFDLPLMESSVKISDETVFTHADWRFVFGLEGWRQEQQPVDLKHLLTHRRIHARFYPVRVSGQARRALHQRYQQTSREDFHELPKSRLLERFISRLWS